MQHCLFFNDDMQNNQLGQVEYSGSVTSFEKESGIYFKTGCCGLCIE
jgi:hypothetical protein